MLVYLFYLHIILFHVLNLFYGLCMLCFGMVYVLLFSTQPSWIYMFCISIIQVLYNTRETHYTVGQQLPQGCLQMTRARFELATWKLRVRYSTTRPLAPTEAHGCEQLAQSCYLALWGQESNSRSLDHNSGSLTTTLPSHPICKGCLSQPGLCVDCWISFFECKYLWLI